MKCSCGGRLLSKTVRERSGEVYRRRYCKRCKARVTTLERVVTLEIGQHAKEALRVRSLSTKGNWWNPAPPTGGKKRTIMGMGE